jgi:hypothetical protein
MIVYCGLGCDSCSIHLATLEQDQSRQQTMRESIAGQLTKHYGIKTHPKDVNDCDGCLADTGNIFSGCLKCELRKCAVQKNIKSCAYCGDYACEKLMQHFMLDPGAKARLEEIRRKNKV